MARGKMIAFNEQSILSCWHILALYIQTWDTFEKGKQLFMGCGFDNVIRRLVIAEFYMEMSVDDSYSSTHKNNPHALWESFLQGIQIRISGQTTKSSWSQFVSGYVSEN